MSKKIKRNPDAAVSTTVAQVVKQQKSKRMMMFGLRNLSELCSPGNIKYKENSLAAMMEGIVPALKNSVETYIDDEEVIASCAKVLSGIAVQLTEDPEPEIIAKFKQEGGVDALLGILSNVHGYTDEDILFASLTSLDHLEKLHIAPDGTIIAGSLVQCIKRKVRPAIASKCLTWLSKFSEKPENLDLLCQNAVADRVVDLLSSTSASNDEETIGMMEKGLLIVQRVAKANKATALHMEGVIKTMDTFKTRKTIVDKGSLVLASMLGPDALKQCLDALATAPTGSNERQEALIMLSSMSYISSYADAVVAAGGIPLLCDAVKTSTQDLQAGSKEQQLIKGLNGACKMLAKIGKKPQNTDAILNAGGLEVLTQAFKCTGAYPGSLAASAEALAELVKREDAATEFQKLEGYKAVIEALKKNMKKVDFTSSAVTLILSALAHNSFTVPIHDLGAVGVISQCLAAGGDSTFKENIINSLTLLAPSMKSIDEYKTAGGHKALLESLNETTTDMSPLVVSGLNLISRLMDVPDAMSELQTGSTADAVLGTMLAYQDTAEVQFKGKAILERIATEEDVKRCLQNLDRSIAGARSDPQKAYKSLAAVNGLSQVNRLKEIFEEKKAADSIQKGVLAWIEGPQFPEQQKLIKAGSRSIESLKIGSPNPLDATIASIFNTCLAPQVKSLIDKQEAKDNNLLDLIRCCRQLCKQRQISSASLPSIFEAVTKVSWKYQDVRQVEVECLQLMTELAMMNGGEGVKILSDIGAFKSIISYLHKVVIYEDVQAAGLELLGTLLKQDASTVEPIRFAGGVELCKAIRAAHSGSSNMRLLLAPVANALMPSESLDADIKKAIDSTQRSIMENDMHSAVDCITNLGNLTSTADGVRSSVHNRIGLVLQDVSAFCERHAPVESAELSAETSKLIKNIVDSRAGIGHITRCGGVPMLGNLLNVLVEPSVPDSSMKREGISANLYCMRRIMKAEKHSMDPVIAHRQIATFCLVMGAYPDDTNISGAASAALAAVSSDYLTKSSEFTQLMQKLINDVKTGDPQTQAVAIRALGEMLHDGDDALLQLVSDQNGIEALFQALDSFAENPSVRHDILRTLLAISNKRNLAQYFKKTQGDEGRIAAIGLLTRTLKFCGDDVQSATAISRLINRMTTAGDSKVLHELEILSLAGDLLQQYPDSKDLSQAIGELLGKVGAGEAIEALIKQIISTVKSKPPEWQRTTEVLCNKLAVLLPAGTPDPQKAFEKVPELCDTMSTVIASEKGDIQLLASIALVSRRLVDRFADDAISPYGLKATELKLMPTIAVALSKDIKIKQNRNFLINSYRVMAVLAKHPKTNAAAIASSTSSDLIAESYETMKAFNNDPDVLTRILEYLAALGHSPSGVKAILAGYKPTEGRSIEEDLGNHVLAIMRKHKKHGGLVAASINLLQVLQMEEKALLDGKYVKEIGLLAEGTSEGLTAHMKSLQALLEAGYKPYLGEELEKVDERFLHIYNMNTTNTEQKGDLAIAYANLIGALAKMGEVDELKKSCALDTLGGLLEDFRDDPLVLLHIVNALKGLADIDSDFNAKIARQIGGVLMGDCASAIGGNPMLCEAVLGLLYSLGCNEGNGRLLASTVGFTNLMTAISITVGQMNPKEAEGMQKLLDNFNHIVEQDDPKALTLHQVYERWNSRKTAGDTLEISESAIVLQQFDFVVDYTEEYSKEKLDSIESEIGSEFRYGCLCFSLLHEYPSNTAACIEKGEPRFMLRAIEYQKDDAISHLAIVVCRDLCANPEGASNLAMLPRSQEITVNAVKRLSIDGKQPEAADEAMIPRLELIERVAIGRHHYNGTECMEVLISVWNDCDKELYTTETLRRVFRAMRKIVNETWVEPILTHKIPRRLIEVINNPKSDLVLLPDVLFLLSALGTVPEVKTLIGELKGVEACLDLLRRCLKNTTDNTSPVQTNACLALANITISHGPNISKFVAAKGIEMNVEVMESSMATKPDYDVGNAASVLMCNLCYRRDDIKELFGAKGGPLAVTATIQKYDGEDSKAAFRCMASMLKAIGNLALFTPNVQAFLDQGVEKTFAHFYVSSEFLPDELLEVSLRTMSNLVLEYTDDYMEKFGVALVPLLTMLQQTRRESVKMLSLAFEVLGNLCRLPNNTKKFADHGGIDTTLKIVNTHSDTRLSATAIHVLSVQMNNPEGVTKLIDAGVFTFLVSLFESQATADDRQTELCIAGLRCARRLLVNRPCADVFTSAEGAQAVTHLMTSCPESSMIQLDGYKILLTLIALFPPPPPVKATAVDEEWDAAVEDEGILGVIHRMERPLSPRSWEAIRLTPTELRRLVTTICACLGAEGHGKQIKLQRCGLGLLAYIACEKIPGTVEGFHEGQFHLVAKQALTNFPGEHKMIKTVIYLLCNILYISDPEDYAVVAKDKGLVQALNSAAGKIPKREIHFKESVVLTEKLLADRKHTSPKNFEVTTSWDYPIDLTEWNKDPYPNGVQDLSSEIKKELREGGRMKLVVDAKTRIPFWWKSSQDMTMLQWKISDDSNAPYNQQMPISRIRSISRGITTQLLESAAAKDRKIDDKVCIVLIGPPSEESPNGIELNLKVKSRKERDHLGQMFSEWRDAATYGF